MRFLVFLLLVSNAALADDAGVLRCRAIKDSAARLACYDALVVPSAAVKAAPASSGQATPQSQAATPATAKAAPAPEQFGMENKRQPETALDAIESTIPGRFDGWGPKSRIRLANGQVWQVADDSSAAISAAENQKVVVRRGMLGAFFLEFEGTNRSPRVKRVQ